MKRLGAILICLSLVEIGGAQYQLEKFVIASGGGTSTGSNVSIQVTIAEPLAGGFYQGGSSSTITYLGFWAPELVPTAANVSVGGRVLMLSGAGGIGNARVELMAFSGETQAALTNPHGYFRFDNVPVGETYLLKVSHKQHEFEPRVITVVDEVTDLEIVPIQGEKGK